MKITKIDGVPISESIQLKYTEAKIAQTDPCMKLIANSRTCKDSMMMMLSNVKRIKIQKSTIADNIKSKIKCPEHRLAPSLNPKLIDLKASDNTSIKNRGTVVDIKGFPMTITNRRGVALPKRRDLLESTILSRRNENVIMNMILTPTVMLLNKFKQLDTIINDPNHTNHEGNAILISEELTNSTVDTNEVTVV